MERLLRAVERGSARLVLELVGDYVARRIRGINPDDLLDAIEKGECRLVDSLSDGDRRLFEKLARRFGHYVDYLRLDLVFEWLRRRAPFHAGIIYGHPKGIEFLRRCIEDIREHVYKMFVEAEAEVVEGGKG